VRTLDDQNIRSFSLQARLARDLRLVVRLLLMVKAYFTTGASIRRRYREKQRRGETYYLDE